MASSLLKNNYLRYERISISLVRERHGALIQVKTAVEARCKFILQLHSSNDFEGPAMGQKLSYENRLEIASRISEELRLFYPDRIVVLSDTTALRLGEPIRDTKEKD
jgi:hypothetical protein